MTRRKRTAPLAPTRWSTQELDSDRLQSVATFRRERLEEPVENYGELFDDVLNIVEDLLESTVDLALVDEQAVDILSDRAMRATFRYLAGPPISEDDLKTLVDTNSLAPATLRNDPDLVARLVETVLSVLDRRRFP